MKLTAYLQRRQVPGPWCLQGERPAVLRGAVIIPALAESEALPATLRSLARNPPDLLARWLVVVVVNQTLGVAPELADDNLRCLAQLKQPPERLQLALVDAASAGLELPKDKGGVGLARKIGTDLVLPWLGDGDALLAFLDADSWVAEDYLAALEHHFTTHAAGAAVVPYCHRPGESAAVDLALRDYELYLRGHLYGLQLAGSPYAYATIGSTMACRLSAYVRAGGMNCRKAGEDFYFLQQLAKTGGVVPLQGTLVQPSARLSARTPFGTGVALQRSLQGEQPITAIPASAYAVLRGWLSQMAEENDSSVASLLQQAAEISSPLADFLRQNRFGPVWEGLCRQHLSPEARLRAFHEWFDSLKSLRLLHHLVARGLSRVSPSESVAGLRLMAGQPRLEGPAAQLDWLRRKQGVPMISRRLAAPAG